MRNLRCARRRVVENRLHLRVERGPRADRVGVHGWASREDRSGRFRE
jgi:hypothetical protein